MTGVAFILASQSPRRQALLRLLGRPFQVIVSGADEESGTFAGPDDYVVAIARRKAEAVAALPAVADGLDRPVLIAADTTVALDGQIMAKPADAADARRMLAALGGRTHEVHTGLCVIDLRTGAEYAGVHTAAVTMRRYTPDEIDAYVASGDPLDKAGAYAIQHPVFRPVEALSGCYLGVMGLSVCHLIDALGRLGIPTAVDAAGLHRAHDGYPCPLLPEALALLSLR